MRAMRQPLRLHLKDGVEPTQAIEILTARIGAANNLAGAVSRGGLTPEADAVYLERRQADYLDWAEVTEGQLGNVTHDPDVLTLPYSPVYYEIRQLTPSSPRAVASSTQRSRARSGASKACAKTLRGASNAPAPRLARSRSSTRTCSCIISSPTAWPGARSSARRAFGSSSRSG